MNIKMKNGGDPRQWSSGRVDPPGGAISAVHFRWTLMLFDQMYLDGQMMNLTLVFFPALGAGAYAGQVQGPFGETHQQCWI